MNKPSDYGALAIARGREVPVRVGFGVFVAVGAWVCTQGPWGFIWFAAMVAAQLFDAWVSAPIRRRPEVDPSQARKIFYGVSIGLSAAVYSSICAPLWWYGGDAGRAFAMLVPAGAVLNMSLLMERNQRAVIAGWAPHGLWLVGLPVVAGVLSPQKDLLELSCVAMAAVLFLAHVMVTVQRIQQSTRRFMSANEEADRERTRAERASAAKSDFLATISHEIRTPMNAVVAAGGLLRRTPLNPEQAAHVAMLEDSTEILMGLLNDVLDLSKIESGKLELEAAEFDLVKKLEGAVALWRPRAEQKGVRLQFEDRGLPERIVTDPLRFQQIVFNLLSNAVKFTDHGEVRLSGGRAEGRDGEVLWLEVSDTGCGMNEEASQRVFAGFEQASAGTARRHGGTGLGLSISRRLAGMLGGSLTVRSREGEGSVFRFATPLVEAEARSVPAQEAPEVSLTVHASGVHILVAEDHEVNQRVLQLILEPLGFRMTVVANGREAVEAAAQQPYDVIIMDMQMPVMGGVEASRIIRQGCVHNRCTPIIALTANALQEHRAQWTAAGVHLFMTKPVDMKALIETVSLAAEQRSEAVMRVAS